MLIRTGATRKTSWLLKSKWEEAVKAVALLNYLATEDESSNISLIRHVIINIPTVKSVFESPEFKHNYPNNLKQLKLEDFIKPGDEFNRTVAFKFIAFLHKEFHQLV
jgi:hypothetical protein